MMRRPTILASLWSICVAAGSASACPLLVNGFESFGGSAPVIDDLCPLSDEFNDPATLAQWQRLYQTEGWPNQLQGWDIHSSRSGHMTLLPYASSWYEDLRGVLVYKPVTGDFIVSTRFNANNRAGTAAPNALYSLAGLFIRRARAISHPGQWTPGGENYVFLSAGAADQVGVYQYEVKTTENSVSLLQISAACVPLSSGLPTFELRVARLDGVHFIMLRRDQDGSWQVHRRYRRGDLPNELQVGLTSYTDWDSINGVYWPAQVFAYNNTVLTTGQPDLLAQFDYIHYQRPHIPPQHQGKNFSAPFSPGDPGTIADADLLAFLAPQ